MRSAQLRSGLREELREYGVSVTALPEEAALSAESSRPQADDEGQTSETSAG